MNLIIIDGLDIMLDITEIAMSKGIKVDNPRYIPEMPDKGIREQNAPAYFDFTEVTLKSGKDFVIELPYTQFIGVVKKWMIETGGIDINKEGTPDESGAVDKADK